METNQNGKFSVDLDLPYPPVQPENPSEKSTPTPC